MTGYFKRIETHYYDFSDFRLKRSNRPAGMLSISIGCRLICLVWLLALTSVCLSVPEHDLSTEKVLYTVGTAHLDTQWRWTIQKTINDYIKNTLDYNFSLFEQYPNYTFSFEGAFRYMLMKEYYPDKYATMADYIAQGRWCVAGTTLENGDMNVVSPESLIRQALIGNNYFEDEFNKRSTDIFLPDCFGFSYTMPTWGAHCGINGFSSQKLSWGGAIAIPFNIGVWKGPDGASIIAALNPGSYTSTISSDLSNDSGWLTTINALGDTYGVYAGYKYFGTGDTGGAPSSGSCSWLEQSIAGSGPITVDSAASDQLYNDITAAQKAALPVYDGELLMRIHGTGCYTSQAAMKRWNRQNELLADSAERVSVVADWLGALDYPRQTLDDAWIRFLWHTFHDDITGTSIPQAYHFSWNDEILSLNQFAAIINSGAAGICQALDTNTLGVPVVVYNPLGFARTDITEATLVYEEDAPSYVQVFDGATEVPSQILSHDSRSITVAFLADVPSVGFKVYDVRSTAQPCGLSTGLSVTNRVLENSLYRVTLNDSGDIASIWDKVNNREFLSAPCRLELLSDYSPSWPAWEIRYEDVQQMPYAYVTGPAQIAISENGPARVALRIKRTYGQDVISTFIQEISLSSGSSGNRITIDNKIDWKTTGTLLKASFPMTAYNSHATYDLGMGTIQRPNNQYSMYEVPAQQWADITHADGSFGVAVLNDSRYGWDKPMDNILRLTLLHTPSVSTSYTDQSTLDIGQHQVAYAIAPHAGNWINGGIPQNAARLNQPLIAFQSQKHIGSLGSVYSFLQVDNPQVFVKAIKKAQRTDEVIIRFQELYGTTASNVQVSVGNGIQSAREVNGCERDLAAATVTGGQLVFSMTKYQPKTFALTLAAPASTAPSAAAASVQIPYDMDVFSWDTNRSDGNFENGLTYPAELIEDTIEVGGIPFQIGSRMNGQMNAISCNGQTISLGSHSYASLYLLAASRNGDSSGTFIVSGQERNLSIQDYHENVVDWGRDGGVPYLKNDTAAWVGTHRHSTGGNLAYEFCMMYAYRIDLPVGANSIVLPDNSSIVIFAMTLATSPSDRVNTACPLYDSLPYIPELAPKPETRTNLALGKTVWADTFISGENPEKAVDGTVWNNSKWCAATAILEPHWLVIDLGQDYDVDTFVIRHAGDGGETSDWNTRDFCIQSSPDGISNWSDLVCVQGNTRNVSRLVIDPVSTRYLRLYVTTPTQNSNTAVRIYEVEVYSPCDGSWLPADVSGPDGVQDCRIDLYDLKELSQDWLVCNEPMDSECLEYWQTLFPEGYFTNPIEDGEPVALPVNDRVAYWRVQEGPGQTHHDLAGTDDAGSLLGTTVPTWASGWFSPHGQDNFSLYFSGAGYVIVNPASGTPLYDVQNAITISVWFKAADWNGNRRILQKGKSDNQYRVLAEWNNLVFHIYNVGRITTTLPSAGVWHHLAAVYDGTSMRLYVDGILKTSLYASGSINRTSDPLYIGTKTPSAPSGDYYKGYLDDIQIYSVALTEQEIRELARQGDNAPPVILGINRREDILTSIMGSSYLDAAVYDVNNDLLTYQWTETSSSPSVSFSPSITSEHPEAVFSQAGVYTVQLAVTDQAGQSASAQTEFNLVEMDCAAVKQMNYRIGGDVNQDCYVSIEDLSAICESWLYCSGQGCP
jgi:alpha-mannosidase